MYKSRAFLTSESIKADFSPFALGFFFHDRKTFSEIALTLDLTSSCSESVYSLLTFFFGSFDLERLTFFSSSSFFLFTFFSPLGFLSSFKGDFLALGLAFLHCGPYFLSRYYSKLRSSVSSFSSTSYSSDSLLSESFKVDSLSI